MDVARRDIIRSAAAAALLGQFTAEAMQHVHEHAAEAKKQAAGVYKPKVLTAGEWKTVTLLADLIIPPEDGQPGGAGAGAPEFIDVLCSGSDQMARIWQGGLAWLDAASRHKGADSFVDATAAQRTELLDLIAYRKNDSPELGPGIRFFDWARRMVVDAYFTSPAGVKALGFVGNVGMQTFQVPAEALTYAISRSPFKDA